MRGLLRDLMVWVDRNGQPDRLPAPPQVGTAPDEGAAVRVVLPSVLLRQVRAELDREGARPAGILRGARVMVEVPGCWLCGAEASERWTPAGVALVRVDGGKSVSPMRLTGSKLVEVGLYACASCVAVGRCEAVAR